ncbi:fimbrial biogenesis chaperone [Xanthomonas axonopodis]
MKKVLLCAALAIATLNAQAMQITPLGQTISPSKSSGSLTITNTSTEKKEYQLKALKWTLVDGKQFKTGSDDIRFAPSAFYLEPGKSQTVRFINSQKSTGELAYRVIATEKNVAKLEKTGVDPIFNMNFPIFWRSSDKALVEAKATGQSIVLRNSSQSTAQIANLKVGSFAKPGLFGYLLPGEALSIPGGGASSISALINGVQTEIAVE